MRSTVGLAVQGDRSVARLRVFIGMLLSLLIAACGGGSSSSPSTAESAPVAISSLAPASAFAGGAAFVLTVTGSGFVSGSVAQWNGQTLPTQYVSATSLTATVPAADIAAVGTASITVSNASAGGAGSSVVSFAINEGPSPALTSLAPAAAAVGSGSFTLVVTGKNFTSQSTVLWNGKPQPTVYDSSMQLSVSIGATELSGVSTVAVTVMNDAAEGGTSNPAAFDIQAVLPAPTLKSITPNTIPSGTTNVTLTATGTNFTKTALIYIEGNAVPTKYVSATTLTATVPSTYLVQQGNISITVADIASGDVPTGAQTLSVPPVLRSLSPSSISAGSAGFTLTVTGAQLSATTVVYWNGTALATTFQNTSSLVAQVPSQDIASSSTVTVTLEDPASGDAPSNPATLTILPPVPTLKSITPNSIPAGTTNVTLTATGTNFTKTALIYIDGNAVPTKYVSATMLTATVPNTYLAQQGEISITVADVASGGVPTGAQTLSVAPVLRSLSPSFISAGSAGFTLTVTGAQLSSTTVVYWNGTALTTTFLNTSTLVAQVPSQDVASPSTVTVTLEDPVSGEAPSNGLSFTVQATKLALSNVSPTSVVTGGKAFTLTAGGSGFVAASVVTLGGTSLPTTYVSSTVLTAKVSAAQIASAGSLSVAVVNSAGAGGTSGTLPLVVGSASKDAVSFQITAAHAGAIAFNSVMLPASSAWTVDLGGQPSYAVIVGGTVFVTVGVDGNSQLVALSGATGAKLWGPIAIAGGSNATYDNGTLFVLSSVFGGSGLMQAFDPATGKALWSTSLTEQYEFVAPPVAAQGIVATQGAGEGSTIYALNESNGAIAWTQNLDAGTSGTVALSVDGVYESQPCQTYDFGLPTGLPVWQQNTGCDGGGGATPVVANGSVYSPIDTGYDGTIYAAETGAVLGSFAADVAPAVTATAAYMLQSQTLRSIAVSNNQVNWSFAGDGALVTSPIVVNNYVFVGSSRGNLYAVDATTGAQVWTKSLGAAIPASPGYAPQLPYTGLAAGDGLLVVPNGTSVTAFVLSSSP
jgi:outer membrane protein assembly factor BamB